MKITLYRKEFQNTNCLVAKAGSNCPQGGDAGHGGRTVLSFKDMGGTVLDVAVEDEDGHEHRIEQAAWVSLIFSGDAEHKTAIQALEFILGVLKGDQAIQASADGSKVEDIK